MDNVTTPKKVNIPLILLLLVAIVAVVLIFALRSSPDIPTPTGEGPIPNPPAVTDPDLKKPQSPEQSPAPGGTSDSTPVGIPPSLK